MKKIIAIFLGLIIVFAVMGCNKKAESVSEGESSSTETVKNPIVTLNSFDNQEAMNRLMLRGVLGKVELNTSEKEYIKGGDGSAKVTVIGNPYKMAQPCLYQASRFFNTGEDYSDFSKVSTLSLWVYNAQTEKRKIGLQFVYNEFSIDLAEWVEIGANAWTKVQINVEREYLTIVDGKATVEGINVLFNRLESDEVYYLDEFCLYRTEVPFTPIVKTLAEDEICSFDKYWQVKKIGLGCWGALQLSPSVVWVNDVTSTGKGSAIKVETVNTGNGDQWPYVALNDTVFSIMNLSEYENGDYLCFDVYAPEMNGMDRLWVEAYSSTGLKFFTSDPITLKNGQWMTVKISVEKLNARGYFEDLTELRVLHKGYKSDSPKIFYLDEFRMERGE